MKRRADGRWQKKITIDGVQKYFYSSASTQKKAEEDFNQQLLNFVSETDTKKTNFKSIADRMIEKKEATTSYNNVTNYKNQLKHLSPLFTYNIEDISIIQLQNLFNELYSKSHGYWTLQKTKTVLGLVYKEAILSGCKVSNLVEFIKLPHMHRETVHAPDDNTITSVKLNVAKDFGMWAMMLLCTGMRRGELAAIQKKDIDFEQKTISITKSIEYIHNQPHAKTPKTQNGVRTIPVIDMLLPLLKNYVELLSDNDYLFGGQRPYTLTMIRKRWSKYLNQSGLSITQHQLRHAYAFLLYRSGVDVKTAQYLLGHSNYATTMNIYTDFDIRKLNKSATLLNTTLDAIGVKKVSSIP